LNPDTLLRLLEDVAQGRASPAAVLDRLALLPYEEVRDNGRLADPFARVDHHRQLRMGMPEVVYCAGKTPEQVVAICSRLARTGGAFLATRADEAARRALATTFPRAEVNEAARTVLLAAECNVAAEGVGTVLIASAGTADLPVAEEAAVTAIALGNPVERLYDVGVAGLHRLLESAERLRSAAVIIVVAGMEGALPSVVGGLVSAPVIAVPTSVGYGASFGGVAALLAMLNSCASGVTVVNIDNGFGAACAATRINRALARLRNTNVVHGFEQGG
jgi:NCAIR mutase (PurE)-related protein